MYLNQKQSAALTSSLQVLVSAQDPDELRHQLAVPITRLLGADCMVSRDHNPRTSQYSIRVAHNMDPAHVASYDRYYQFCDPVTPRLKPRGCASFSQVFAAGELARTEFFNDFLRVHGIHWGVNLYAQSGGRCVGDLLVFRSRTRNDFDQNDLDILRMIEPAFAAALLRFQDRSGSPETTGLLPGSRANVQHGLTEWGRLTERESQVAMLAARGQSDKQIARDLKIELTTVRYYLTNALRKLNVKGRTRLAMLVAEVNGTKQMAALVAEHPPAVDPVQH